MERFLFINFLSYIRRLDIEARKCDEHSPADPVSESERSEIAGIVEALRDECARIDLLRRSPIFSLTVNKLRGGCSFELLSTRLLDLRFAVIQALTEQQAAFIPAARSAYFERDALFGEKVAKSFMSAGADIKEGGSCFATGAFTASVFHLMRAVERVLRVLAKDRRVPLPSEYDLKGWGELIDSVEGKVNEIDNWPRSRAKTEALSFYRGAIGEFRAFKDVWRHHVMHARESYDEQRALSVMNHVQEFTQRLAAKLSERRRTPLHWK